MTQATLIELVTQHHPEMSHTEVRLRLNLAQDDFCAKTELIKKTYVQPTVAGKRYYTLDTDILKILKVQLNDVEIQRLVTPPAIDDDEFDAQTGRNDSGVGATKFAWYVDSQRIGIVEYNSAGITSENQTSNWQSISTSDKEIRLFTIGQAIDFTTTTSLSSELPTQFHEALSFKVIAEGYLRGSSFNGDLAGLFEQRFLAMVKEGKSHARSNYQYTGMIRPQDY